MRWWLASSGLGAVYASITTGAYSTGFALYLGASNAQVGLLSAAPAWGQIIQLFSPLLTERLRRHKPLCLAAYGVSYSLWFLIAAIPWFLPPHVRPVAFIALVMVAGAVLGAAAPSSTSWLTDLVPPQARAQFIGRQQSTVAVVALAASLVAGRYIDSLPDDGRGAGFATIILVAVGFGLAAIAVWAFAPEPPRPERTATPMLGMLALPFRNANFRRLTTFVAARTLAVMIAGPFFAVYMLQNLGIPYSQIAIFSAVSTGATVLSNPLWAYLSGKFGYRPVANVCGTGLVLVPLVWTVTTPANYAVLVPLNMLWAGLMAAGVILGQANLLMAIAPADNRSVYLGCHSAIANIALALGAALGGVLADRLEGTVDTHFLGLHITHLHAVFLISATCRGLSQLLLRTVHEEGATSTAGLLGRVRSGRPLSTGVNLVRMWRARGPSARADQVRALGETRSGLALEELIGLLDDADLEVRREAARAVGRIADPAAVPGLIAAADDPETGIVADALEALGRMESPQAEEYLLSRLDDPTPLVRATAAVAASRSGGEPVARALVELLAAETDPAVFVTAAEALSRASGARAMHVLRRLLRHAEPGLRRRELASAVATALGDTEGFYALLEAEAMHQEDLVAKALGRARRRLSTAARHESDGPEYIAGQTQAALAAFSGGRPAEAIAACHRAATRAVNAAASSRDFVRVVASHREGLAPSRSHRRMRALLNSSQSLRLSFGFLGGAVDDARHFPDRPEDALLAVHALGIVASELSRIRRANGAASDPGAGLDKGG